MAEAAASLTGGCLCGRIRYEVSDKPIWTGHCHCRWCQKQSGAAFMTLVMFRTDQVLWLSEAPSTYRSSPEVERGFCPNCGSSLTFARAARDEINLLAGTLDDPSAVRPTMHIFTAQACPWVSLEDGLTRYDRYPPGGEDRALD